jgi:predicted nucleotidyltransferase
MDIESVFKSKTRKALFQLFFTNPETSFYVRELERALNTPVAMIHRELIKLEKSGIFTSHTKGNVRYYSLNRAYPLFNELKSIVFKTVGVQGVLTETLKEIPNITASFLFGSYAANTAHAGSDIDLFIVGSPDEDILIEKINRLEKKLNRDINYSIFSAADLKKKIKANDAFIKDVLQNNKIMLSGSENDLR